MLEFDLARYDDTLAVPRSASEPERDWRIRFRRFRKLPARFA